ncbi:hypothetical protein OAJ39_02025 [Alphaproteobacteria bacterium]|nr:hypothetical protein [Alphaproteobacteria bacterium]
MRRDNRMIRPFWAKDWPDLRSPDNPIIRLHRDVWPCHFNRTANRCLRGIVSVDRDLLRDAR